MCSVPFIMKQTGLSEQDLIQATMASLLAFCRAQHSVFRQTCTTKGHVGNTKFRRPAPCLKYTHARTQTFLSFIELYWINSVRNFELDSFLRCIHTLAVVYTYSKIKVCVASSIQFVRPLLSFLPYCVAIVTSASWICCCVATWKTCCVSTEVNLLALWMWALFMCNTS